MICLDADVLINLFIEQDSAKHKRVTQLFEETVADGQLIISWLSVQETAFVLGKLNQPLNVITSSLDLLISLDPVSYGSEEFIRASDLAKTVGFKNYNDCLLTAIAEKHCKQLYT